MKDPMDPIKTMIKAARVMGSQGPILRMKLENSVPKVEPGSMLFKRSIQVVADTELEALIKKWNPGLSPHLLQDIITTVSRWNHIDASGMVKAGQTLLIQTIIPLGQEPGMLPSRRSPTSPMQPVQPGVSPEMRLQTKTLIPSALAGPRMGLQPSHSPLWATGSQQGKTFAGESVKQQFNKTSPSMPSGQPSASARPGSRVPHSPLWTTGSQQGKIFAGESVKQQFQKSPEKPDDDGAWG